MVEKFYGTSGISMCLLDELSSLSVAATFAWMVDWLEGSSQLEALQDVS